MDKLIDKIPLGASEVLYNGRRYGLTRTDYNQGRSTKVYANELGGSDHISFNFYRTRKEDLLKPCEMPEEKVIAFLEGAVVVEE